MKRSPLSRRTPLARGGRLRRSSRRQRALDQLWQVRRRQALELTEGCCIAHTPVCPSGDHRADEVHHMLPRSAGGGHELANLLPCCGDAHDYIHAHPAESYERGWLRRRGAA